MMENIQKLMSELRNLDIKIWVENDSLSFNAPKGALTSDIKEKLVQNKKDLILFLKDIHQNNTSPQIPVIKREQEIPLSFSQRRLWFISQLQDSSSYHIKGMLRLCGHIDISTMERAFLEIIKRHEILRTTFSMGENNEAIQIISPLEKFSLVVKDLQNIDPKDQQNKVIEMDTQQNSAPFSLEKGPLFRAALYCLHPQKYMLSVTMHHIISDGWSSRIIVDELTQLYESLHSNQVCNLPNLSIQYADFAHWQRQRLQGEILEKQLHFWKEHLKDAPMLLELQTDYSRPVAQTFAGAAVHFEIPSELTSALQNLSRNKKTTLFTTLFAAWNILLHRYTQQQKIIIGTPIANRNYKEIEPLIGFFANTLAISTHLEGNLSFETLLETVHQTMMTIHDHQDFPFELLVEALQVERNLSYNPIFQAMFVLHNEVTAIPKISNTTTEWIEPQTTETKFDITLTLTNQQDKLIGKYEYNTSLFKASTIERMCEHFITLLEAIVAKPQEKIAYLPIMTSQELEKILVKWNDTYLEYPNNICFHELFEKQVAKTPKNDAIVFQNTSLTYSELNQKANQLAHHLKSKGVTSGSIVGICLYHSLETFIAVFAILKAGGTYVPLSPTYPRERLLFIMDDCEMSLVITTKNIASEHLQKNDGCVYIDEQQTTEQYPQNNPENLLNAESIVYIMYTSGSTGKPKGVMISHRNLVSYLWGINKKWELREGINGFSPNAFVFDGIITSIYCPLIIGGKATLTSEQENVLEYQQLLECENDYSFIKMTPLHLKILEHMVQSENLKKGKRTFFVGAQALFWNHLSYWQKHLPDAHFINHYGPTETTVGCSAYDVDTLVNEENISQPIPIGKPLPNYRLYILDRYQQPTPIGVCGELYIGGEGVAKGYLNRPELTKEKFVNWEYNGKSHRLYRTGDKVFRMDDGNIVFLGRMDWQVKIRGVRIELGEIESVLLQHDSIKETVVTAYKDEYLIAYIVFTEERNPNTEQQLRHYLEAKLPEIMIPSTFVFMEALPLTNGKINRKALPIPEKIGIEKPYVAPQTPSEHYVISLWSNLLYKEKIGSNDHFFELGGHSLLATVFISQIRKEKNIDIPLRKLFEKPVVAEFANYLDLVLKIQSNKHENIHECEEIEI